LRDDRERTIPGWKAFNLLANACSKSATEPASSTVMLAEGGAEKTAVTFALMRCNWLRIAVQPMEISGFRGGERG